MQTVNLMIMWDLAAHIRTLILVDSALTSKFRVINWISYWEEYPRGSARKVYLELHLVNPVYFNDHHPSPNTS